MKPRPKLSLNKAMMLLEYQFTKYFWPVFEAYRGNDGGGIIAALNPAKGGGASRVRSSGHIKPTRSDFLADVEKAAKAVLSKAEQRHYLEMTFMKKIPDNKRYWEIENTLGKEFLRRGIFPLSIYFKDVYCVPKGGKP